MRRQQGLPRCCSNTILRLKYLRFQRFWIGTLNGWTINDSGLACMTARSFPFISDLYNSLFLYRFISFCVQRKPFFNSYLHFVYPFISQSNFIQKLHSSIYTQVLHFVQSRTKLPLSYLVKNVVSEALYQTVTHLAYSPRLR